MATAAALVSAAVFAFGGCMLSTVNMVNFMQSLAWLPVVLWAFERDSNAPHLRHWVVAALAMCGAPVMATDLRASVSLVIAGLVAVAHHVAGNREIHHGHPDDAGEQQPLRLTKNWRI